MSELRPTPNQIRPIARSHRRRVLRQLGLSPKDLDPIGRGYLDLYCRLVAKVELIDQYIAVHGLLQDDGEPQPALGPYVSLTNSTRLALARLEAHVGVRNKSPGKVLAETIDATYGDRDES